MPDIWIIGLDEAVFREVVWDSTGD